MAILITKSSNKVVADGHDIIIAGTDISANPVYMRIESKMLHDGKVMEIYPRCYSSRQAYLDNRYANPGVRLHGSDQILNNYFPVAVNPGEHQSTALAHKRAKTYLENLDYECEFADISEEELDSAVETEPD
jgi:hypothetical protein